MGSTYIPSLPIPTHQPLLLHIELPYPFVRINGPYLEKHTDYFHFKWPKRMSIIPFRLSWISEDRSLSVKPSNSESDLQLVFSDCIETINGIAQEALKWGKVSMIPGRVPFCQEKGNRVARPQRTFLKPSSISSSMDAVMERQLSDLAQSMHFF